MKTVQVEISANAEPLVSFVEMLDVSLKTLKRSVKLAELPPDLARIETDNSGADAGKVIVTFYPSDAFLRYVGTFWASNRDLGIIKKS